MKTRAAANKSSNINKFAPPRKCLPRNQVAQFQLPIEANNNPIWVPKKMFKCGYCDYSTFHLRSLVGHMQVHKTKQPNVSREDIINLKCHVMQTIKRAGKKKQAIGNIMVTKNRASLRRRTL